MNNISVELAGLVAEFNDQTLSKVKWTHEAHLCVGLWHVKKYSFEDAICRLRAGIILLNEAHGTANNDSSGYHETLTIFWVKVISFYVALHPDKNIEELPLSFLKSKLAERSFPFEFYERDKILSSEYRSIYKEEEIKKLNQAAVSLYL